MRFDCLMQCLNDALVVVIMKNLIVLHPMHHITCSSGPFTGNRVQMVGVLQLGKYTGTYLYNLHQISAPFFSLLQLVAIYFCGDGGIQLSCSVLRITAEMESNDL